MTKVDPAISEYMRSLVAKRNKKHGKRRLSQWGKKGVLIREAKKKVA